MHTGRVKWFDNRKSYGFIVSPELKGDIFVWYSDICMDGFKTLLPNQKVSFEVSVREAGLIAHSVQVVPEDV